MCIRDSWYDGPTRRSKRIGTKQEFPTKAAAWKEVESLEIQAKPPDRDKGDTVRSVVARYEAERMPSRQSTVRVYRSFLNNHVLPKWGETRIQDVQPRPVELWLRELPLSPKSKTHVRSLMHGLVEFAMWAGMLDISRKMCIRDRPYPVKAAANPLPASFSPFPSHG